MSLTAISSSDQLLDDAVGAAEAASGEASRRFSSSISNTWSSGCRKGGVGAAGGAASKGGAVGAAPGPIVATTHDASTWISPSAWVAAASGSMCVFQKASHCVSAQMMVLVFFFLSAPGASQSRE